MIRKNKGLSKWPYPNQKGNMNIIFHREQAESTNVRIVYDASAKANKDSPLLNECLEIGPPLQRKLLDVLLRNRVKPVLSAGDIKQAFLHITIRRNERDALRFLWVNNLESKQEKTYRMARMMFGLGPSLFIQGGALNAHLDKYSISNLEGLVKGSWCRKPG